MQCIGIDVHTNRFPCCYRDEGPTEKRIETFELDEAGLAAFYRTLTADTYVPVEATITSFCFVRLFKDRVKEAIIATCYGLVYRERTAGSNSEFKTATDRHGPVRTKYKSEPKVRFCP
ncbi:MAG: hypothetical protein LBK08_11945 [Treponema sp.]|jgi:hypothetical protein|nr:hypothetical protein [Treponema sp.]